MLRLILLTKLFEIGRLDPTTLNLRSARSSIAWVAAAAGCALVLATLYLLPFVFRYIEREGWNALGLASLIVLVLTGLLWLGLCLTSLLDLCTRVVITVSGSDAVVDSSFLHRTSRRWHGKCREVGIEMNEQYGSRGIVLLAQFGHLRVRIGADMRSLHKDNGVVAQQLTELTGLPVRIRLVGVGSAVVGERKNDGVR